MLVVIRLHLNNFIFAKKGENDMERIICNERWRRSVKCRNCSSNISTEISHEGGIKNVKKEASTPTDSQRQTKSEKRMNLIQISISFHDNLFKFRCSALISTNKHFIPNKTILWLADIARVSRSQQGSAERFLPWRFMIDDGSPDEAYWWSSDEWKTIGRSQKKRYLNY